MPECFVRYDVATFEIYEAFFGPLSTVKPNEAIASIGVRGIVPDARLQRYSGTNGLRDATQVETADYETSRQRADEQGTFDGQKLLKAITIWAAQKFNIPLNQARNEILVIYRGL